MEKLVESNEQSNDQLKWFWIHKAKHVGLNEWVERAELLPDVACFESSLGAWFHKNYPQNPSLFVNQFLLDETMREAELFMQFILNDEPVFLDFLQTLSASTSEVLLSIIRNFHAFRKVEPSGLVKPAMAPYIAAWMLEAAENHDFASLNSWAKICASWRAERMGEVVDAQDVQMKSRKVETTAGDNDDWISWLGQKGHDISHMDVEQPSQMFEAYSPWASPRASPRSPAVEGQKWFDADRCMADWIATIGDNTDVFAFDVRDSDMVDSIVC
jgi:hypothetical protein